MVDLYLDDHAVMAMANGEPFTAYLPPVPNFGTDPTEPIKKNVDRRHWIIGSRGNGEFFCVKRGSSGLDADVE